MYNFQNLPQVLPLHHHHTVQVVHPAHHALTLVPHLIQALLGVTFIHFIEDIVCFDC